MEKFSSVEQYILGHILWPYPIDFLEGCINTSHHNFVISKIFWKSSKIIHRYHRFKYNWNFCSLQKPNPCPIYPCPPGTACQMQPGEVCQPGNCPLVKRCASPCETVRCGNNTTCIAFYVTCSAGSTNCISGLRARCVPNNEIDDPCKKRTCPTGEGCYLNRTCIGSSCKTESYCQDPCMNQNIECKSDEICYAVTVVCITAPCNPISVCKKPCDTIHCKPGFTCFIPKIGIPCQKPPCHPNPICVLDKPK